jgi:hypothetical protein
MSLILFSDNDNTFRFTKFLKGLIFSILLLFKIQVVNCFKLLKSVMSPRFTLFNNKYFNFLLFFKFSSIFECLRLILVIINDFRFYIEINQFDNFS